MEMLGARVCLQSVPLSVLELAEHLAAKIVLILQWSVGSIGQETATVGNSPDASGNLKAKYYRDVFAVGCPLEPNPDDYRPAMDFGQFAGHSLFRTGHSMIGTVLMLFFGLPSITRSLYDT
jgi:hypothetical protein